LWYNRGIIKTIWNHVPNAKCLLSWTKISVLATVHSALIVVIATKGVVVVVKMKKAVIAGSKMSYPIILN
jgi:hypothetical protein